MEKIFKEETLRTSPEKSSTDRFWVRFFLYAIIGAVLAFGIRFIVEPSIVVGESMLPNLHDGEYVMTYKLAYDFGKPNYGDVVIVDKGERIGNDQLFIKRVIGLPNDYVEIKLNQLYINGKPIQESYIKEAMENQEDVSFRLRENEVFVMGDNRNNSLDSRVFGPVDYQKEIRGKVIFRFIPLNQDFQLKKK